MDIKQAREKKDRGMSVQEAIEYGASNESQIKSVCVAFLKNNGEIEIAYSTDNTTELIGVMEQSKHMILDDALYEE